MKFSNSFLHKIRSFRSHKVNEIEGYSEIETKYKEVRNDIIRLKDCLKSFQHYEYGGTLLSKIKDYSKYVQRTMRVNFFRKMGIFDKIGFIIGRIARIIHEEEDKHLANRISESYLEIARIKEKFNYKIKILIREIEMMDKNMKIIEEERKINREAYYDIKAISSKNGYNSEVISAETKAFKEDCKETMKKMEAFSNDIKIKQLLDLFSVAYCEFLHFSNIQLKKLSKYK